MGSFKRRKQIPRIYNAKEMVENLWQERRRRHYLSSANRRQIRRATSQSGLRGLHHMFEDILEEARGDLAGNDLGRVVVHQDRLQDPIVVP